MDNYLSFRWPESAEPERKRKPKKKQKKRRVWRDILVILIAVVILGGLGVGAYFGVQYAAERFLTDLPGEETPTPSNTPDSSDDPSPSTEPFEPDLENWSADMLPQGEHDPSVQIKLHSREGREEIPSADLYKLLLPSIVCVEAYSDAGYGTGSGIIISASGYILTNYHVIEGGMGLNVMLLSDSSIHEATLVGFDKELDLAVIKIEGDNFTPAEFGNSDELTVGDPVYAIGNPLGYLLGVMSDGIVSSRLDQRVAALDYSGRLILTTASLNSGNSGGALIDAYGRVVGITYAKLTGIRDDVVTEGLGLAIPITDARPYINRILRTGDSARPSLGIQCYSPVTNMDGVTGIEVAEATPGTPAHGKLLKGDLITHLNGTRVFVVDDVTRMLAEMDAGDEVQLTLIRKDKEITVTVALYDRLSELQ